MREKLQNTIQKNKFGRFLLRRIVLTLRAFSLNTLIHRILSQKKTRTYLIKSKALYLFTSRHPSLTNSALHFAKQYALERQDFAILYKVSQIYRIQRRHRESLDILIHLITSEKNELKLMRYITHALQAERALEKKTLKELYDSCELEIPEKAAHLMACEYTLHSEKITPNWNSIINLLNENFDYTLANFTILAALGHQKIEYVNSIKNLLKSRPQDFNSLSFSRSMTMVAAAYYRSGYKSKLMQLDKDFNFDSTSWKIYMSFGHGNILEAMNYRGETIKNSFLRFYPLKTKKIQKILTPEKDICGEAFNSLFYIETYKLIGSYSVICDRRLHTVLQKNFPHISFIPKTPRYVQNISTEKFNKLNYNLRDFLDNESFTKTRNANFFTIDYKTLFHNADIQQKRTTGWLKTDNQLKNYWHESLGKEKILIGISANSTIRSKIRDIHMIGLEHWEEIFTLPNCKFINLNASLSEEKIQEYSQKFNIEFITPDIDLFNDFDNLLAIMSILDFAVVPANNMMDFAAALGLKSIVFSPSNIMKTWAIDDDKYIFSEKVKFIFPKNDDNKIEAMVNDGAQYIKNSLQLN